MFFYNRARELRLLEERWQSGQRELVVLSGPRGVGKTALVQHFLQGRPHLYLLGDYRTEADQLAEVTRRIDDLAHGPGLAARPLASWAAGLEHIFRLAQRERLAVVLDEFPHFCASTPDLPSLLQQVWEAQPVESPIMLILSGSDMDFMKHEVLADQRRLPGRSTAVIRLQPLEYWDTPAFFPQYTHEELVLTYMMVGGMPGHLSRFSMDDLVMENLYWNLLHPTAVLFGHARSLLLERLREPRIYFLLLRAIAAGKTRLGEIAEATGLRSQVASKYLDLLQGMGLVERMVPVTEPSPDRSRQGRYRITDNYLAFWFRFVLPYQGYLEEDRTHNVMNELVLPRLSEYAGPYFAEICRRFLQRHRGSALAPVEFDRVGAWWSSTETVAIVAVQGDQVVLVGESAWTMEAMTIRELNDLRRRAAALGGGPGVRYALFSRSGFDANLIRLAEAEGVLLYQLDDLFASGAD